MHTCTHLHFLLAKANALAQGLLLLIGGIGIHCGQAGITKEA